MEKHVFLSRKLNLPAGWHKGSVMHEAGHTLGVQHLFRAGHVCKPHFFTYWAFVESGVTLLSACVDHMMSKGFLRCRL
ncbi:MAG: hypothetical protein ACOX0Y_10930 [Thiopseudomonas sp.]